MPKGKRAFSVKDRGFNFANRFDARSLFDSPIIKQIIKDHPIIYGLCGGMVFTALDHFYEGKSPPKTNEAPPDGSSLYKYLRDRQKDSMGLETLKNLVEWMIKDDDEVTEKTVSEELPKIRKSLDQGNPVPLVLIRTGIGNPTHNHQVLATDYDYNPATKDMKITLYDPNHPGKEPELTMNLKDPGKGIDPKQSTGEPVRGFFSISYSKKRPPAF